MKQYLGKISGKLLGCFFFIGSFYIIFTGGRKFCPAHPSALLAEAAAMGQQSIQRMAARIAGRMVCKLDYDHAAAEEAGGMCGT